jgi:crossover junction endodeoxyribonuclease RuvC
MTQRFLGLDLSLSSPGFAIIEVADGIPRLIAATHVKTSAKQTDGQRLFQISLGLAEFIRDYPFDGIIREKGFSRFVKATQQIWQVIGVINRDLYDYRITDVSPTTVKKTLTGDGKADKALVADAVRRLLRLGEDYRFKTDDESDACAVVLAHLIAEGVVDIGR